MTGRLKERIARWAGLLAIHQIFSFSRMAEFGNVAISKARTTTGQRIANCHEVIRGKAPETTLLMRRERDRLFWPEIQILNFRRSARITAVFIRKILDKIIVGILDPIKDRAL